MKNFLRKAKTVAIGSAPIVIIILAVHLFAPMDASVFWPFIISVILLIAGQALFLVGVDSSILTMGELVGNNIRKLKKLWIILLFGFLFGTMATVAEPAVNVLSDLVHKVSPTVNATLITWVVSSGIGIFVAYGLFRIFRSLSVKWSFLVGYLLTFALVGVTQFISPEFIAIAFDFSGATTGVITVPFILSLGVGVTAVLGKKTEDDSYGLIGLASIGPIITMCILGLIFGGGAAGDISAEDIVETVGFGASFVSSITGILIALLPITVIFFIFNFFFIKLPKAKIGRTLFGIFITICGLTMFLTAVKFGFQGAGLHIGGAFTDPERASGFKYLLIPFGFILGFAITYTEPAIRVLATQIEGNTSGKIKRGTLVFTLALGLAVTVTFGMLRILFGINILWFLVPIFALGIISMPFISNMFVGIAFDSGGVASGTITASFIVPFAIGACGGLGSTNLIVDGFGMIAFIAAIPVVAISALGLIYNLKLHAALRHTKPAPRVQGVVNYLIGVITHPDNEAVVHDQLRTLNARIVTTFAAQGTARVHPNSPFHLQDSQKVFIVSMISKDNANKMITLLEDKYSFGAPASGTGIAFTIPIDKIEI